MTADTARRITGISTPLGGMQWADPGPSDAEVVRYRHGAGPGFFTALGAYRATVGYQVALLAAYYDVDVEGDLASVIPGANGDPQG